jgi:hypothetical protein
VNSERAVQFRKWAAGSFEQFTIKAYVMDDDRMLQSLDLLNKSKGADKLCTHYVFDSFLGIFHGGYRPISPKQFRLETETEHRASHNQSLFVLRWSPS